MLMFYCLKCAKTSGENEGSKCRFCKRDLIPYSDIYGADFFIMARDNNKQLYIFGTNRNMLKKGDAERFLHCDLSRYPVGAMSGFDNQVTVIETSVCTGCDEVLKAPCYRPDGRDVTIIHSWEVTDGKQILVSLCGGYKGNKQQTYI